MSEHYDYAVIGLGALGSATAYELARRGHSVVGLERFELGHHRGASHDTSRILRHSYHTPEYVRLTVEAYDDWARLEEASGESLVTVVAGLDLFPPDPAIPLVDYARSLDDVGIEHALLARRDIAARWPQFVLPEGTVGLVQERAAIVPAGTRDGADAGRSPSGTGPICATTPGCSRCATSARPASRWSPTARRTAAVRSWSAPTPGPTTCWGTSGTDVPLTVTLEQATYFAPSDPHAFEPGRMPLWIWMDEPSFYGFPCYGEPTVKAAQDCGGPPVDPDDRTSGVDESMLGLLDGPHGADCSPASGPPVRSLRCQYTLTPDRDFVLDRVPGHPNVVVGLGGGARLQVRADDREAARGPGHGGAGGDLADVLPDPRGAHRPRPRGTLVGVRRR